ncbi:MAG: TlpA disulfide reductase family protein [Desulfuromonadaceae bacterium]|nr:TlpA disulfide reductase family protein [Desulfuromonas sp.]MDY0184672.1 TlpA disulfide reductase family protein [Desulfuromonadaceae bacterium]
MFNSVFKAIGCIMVLCFMFFGVTACDKADTFQPQTQAQETAAAAKVAPDFTLIDMQGKKVTLSDLRGQVVLVNFWATWCPPCRQEMPSMEELYKQLKPHGVELLAINIEENGPKAVADFLTNKAHSFPILFDQQAQVQRLYRVSRFPETFIVDRNGNIVEHVVGAIDWMQPGVVDFLRSL